VLAQVLLGLQLCLANLWMFAGGATSQARAAVGVDEGVDEAQCQVAVLVYGATPAGIGAALAAARGGHEVLLVDSTRRIGGLLTSGLSYSDFRSFEALTGSFLEFSRRVEAHYRDRYGDDSEQVKACFRGTHGEPRVNLRVLEQMLAEQSLIGIRRQWRLDGVETTPLNHGRQSIVAASFVDGEGALHRVEARLFIDGSYEGDLIAAAGEPYHVGRESRAHYGEPMAGNEDGQADGQLQGYNFRFVMTTDPGNRVMPERPEGYRREDFTGVLPILAARRIEAVFHPGHGGIFRAHMPLMPNGKADVNDTPRAPVRLSMPDINDDWPEADHERRRELFDEHLYYHLGLLWFLQNDSEVPDDYRLPAREWGFCRDEFEDSGHVPPQLYVREGRRMTGQHVFTVHDTARDGNDVRARWHPDSIASGDYIHNCHGTGREGTRFDGRNTGEFYHRNQPFQIPYGVLLPQRSGNLLVPCAVSSSHVGFCALRLEPTWMVLGQAAGWAAVMALDQEIEVQRVPVAKLQNRLHADGLATLYVSDVRPGDEWFAAVQWFGSLGAFHGLHRLPDGKDQPPQPAGLGGQYSEAFPLHAAGLDEPLEAALRKRWLSLLPDGTRAALATVDPAPATRGQFIAAAWEARAAADDPGH
jgi:hypothetical protein